MDKFHWDLVTIDATPIEILLPFVFYYLYGRRRSPSGGPKQLYIDQVNL